VVFEEDMDCDDEFFCYDIDVCDNDELIIYPDGINYDFYCCELYAKKMVSM
jgi:hypothetical protein